MKQSTFDEWNDATGKQKLPARLGTNPAATVKPVAPPKTINELRAIAKQKLGK